MTEEKRSPASLVSPNTKGRVNTEETTIETNVQSIIAPSDMIKTEDNTIPAINGEIVSHLPELYQKSALFLEAIGKVKINNVGVADAGFKS